jgi:ADP-ribose pyrophosphatase
MSKSSRSKAKILSSREVFRGPIFWVTSEQVQEPTGVTARRDVVRHPGSVVILPVEQRHTVGDYLWELPAGRIDEGESEMAAAKRELLEETGYRARRWQRILKYYASPGFVAEPMSLYLATGLRPGDARPEADEVIRFRLFPLPDAVRMVMRGTIRDAKTIAGVLWLAQQDTGRKPRR